MASYKPVTAVLRGLAVLRSVSVERPASVMSIQHATGINRPTIIRMLETLQHAGLVLREPRTRNYILTASALELSMGYELGSLVATAARSVLKSLQGKIGWPSDVGIFDSDAIVVVATTRSGEGRFFYDRRPGFRAPLLATSLGRAYIAFASEEERRAAFALLRQSSEPWNEPARNRQKAAQLIRAIRRNGYATTNLSYAQREYDGKVLFFGVPIMRDSRPVGALNVAYLRETLTKVEAEKRLLPPLKEAATEIAANLVLGSVSPDPAKSA